MDQVTRSYFNEKYTQYKRICRSRNKQVISFSDFTGLTFLEQKKLIKQMRRN